MAKEIVKVQIAVTSTTPSPPLFVYAKGRVHETFMENRRVRDLMSAQEGVYKNKMFFWAEWDGSGQIWKIGVKAPWQDW